MPDIAVTGVTGRLGDVVSRVLAGRGIDHLAVARDPRRLATRKHMRRAGPAAYDDQAFGPALSGASTLLLVSGNLSGRRLAEHRAAIESAGNAGVKRIVYVSLLGSAPDATYINARDHWQTEQVLANAGLRWTVVRPSYYVSTLTRLADSEGVVRGPAPSGRVALVTHEDLAQVIAALLLDRSQRHDGDVVSVTGPVARTLTDSVDTLRAPGVRRFEPISVRDLRRLRSTAGEPPHVAEGWVSWFQSIEAGEVAEVSDAVNSLAAL